MDGCRRSAAQPKEACGLPRTPPELPRLRFAHERRPSVPLTYLFDRALQHHSP
jgi:hypothetical protein